MNEDKTSSADSETRWQALGVLDLTIGPDMDQIISTWLEKQLAPLHLRQAFLNKIIQSAGSAAVRGIPIPDQERHGRVCLNIFVPEQCMATAQTPAGQTWGFFQTEKTESRPDGAADLIIALYLYPES